MTNQTFVENTNGKVGLKAGLKSLRPGPVGGASLQLLYLFQIFMGHLAHGGAGRLPAFA